MLAVEPGIAAPFERAVRVVVGGARWVPSASTRDRSQHVERGDEAGDTTVRVQHDQVVDFRKTPYRQVLGG